ncbi:MAG: acyl carrier protein [Spirochaetes bacterium]|nr:acyl carrier protein [Spirochaetota bacterium]
MMNTDEIYKLVQSYLINDFEVPEEKITPEANLFENLQLDSIDALDMIATLESEYNLKVNEEELKKIRTVQDIVNYILKNVPA